jgi:hypothetical protein
MSILRSGYLIRNIWSAVRFGNAEGGGVEGGRDRYTQPTKLHNPAF